jgi:hypothetical protein
MYVIRYFSASSLLSQRSLFRMFLRGWTIVLSAA